MRIVIIEGSIQLDMMHFSLLPFKLSEEASYAAPQFEYVFDNKKDSTISHKHC